MEEMLQYVTGISHFAVLVADMETAAKQYALLGFVEDAPGVILSEGFGVQAKVMRNGPYVLELVAPGSEDSPLHAQVAANKWYALDHICYKVSDMDAQIALLKKNRFNVTSQKKVSEVWHKNVVLLGNRKMGVIELIEQ